MGAIVGGVATRMTLLLADLAGVTHIGETSLFERVRPDIQHMHQLTSGLKIGLVEILKLDPLVPKGSLRAFAGPTLEYDEISVEPTGKQAEPRQKASVSGVQTANPNETYVETIPRITALLYQIKTLLEWPLAAASITRNSDLINKRVTTLGRIVDHLEEVVHQSASTKICSLLEDVALITAVWVIVSCHIHIKLTVSLHIDGCQLALVAIPLISPSSCAKFPASITSWLGFNQHQLQLLLVSSVVHRADCTQPHFNPTGFFRSSSWSYTVVQCTFLPPCRLTVQLQATRPQTSRPSDTMTSKLNKELTMEGPMMDEMGGEQYDAVVSIEDIQAVPGPDPDGLVRKYEIQGTKLDPITGTELATEKYIGLITTKWRPVPKVWQAIAVKSAVVKRVERINKEVYIVQAYDRLCPNFKFPVTPGCDCCLPDYAVIGDAAVPRLGSPLFQEGVNNVESGNRFIDASPTTTAADAVRHSLAEVEHHRHSPENVPAASSRDDSSEPSRIGIGRMPPQPAASLQLRGDRDGRLCLTPAVQLPPPVLKARAPGMSLQVMHHVDSPLSPVPKRCKTTSNAGLGSLNAPIVLEDDHDETQHPVAPHAQVSLVAPPVINSPQPEQIKPESPQSSDSDPVHEQQQTGFDADTEAACGSYVQCAIGDMRSVVVSAVLTTGHGIIAYDREANEANIRVAGGVQTVPGFYLIQGITLCRKMDTNQAVYIINASTVVECRLSPSIAHLFPAHIEIDFETASEIRKLKSEALERNTTAVIDMAFGVVKHFNGNSYCVVLPDGTQAKIFIKKAVMELIYPKHLKKGDVAVILYGLVGQHEKATDPTMLCCIPDTGFLQVNPTFLDEAVRERLQVLALGECQLTNAHVVGPRKKNKRS
ncbi:hypothetical protein Pelo_14574 [Pelomyxa schiedti]|nr:hypothetical protein Pelo_14574 [Pelomyxa schiedti]